MIEHKLTRRGPGPEKKTMADLENGTWYLDKDGDLCHKTDEYHALILMSDGSVIESYNNANDGRPVTVVKSVEIIYET